ncbi:diguanylate cyclase [Congregibacter brevis]|uniref:diguanylate cyclase n=1 Tax=Congregibacter brevis TaxID=3081201 RepID=UPI003890D2C4
MRLCSLNITNLYLSKPRQTYRQRVSSINCADETTDGLPWIGNRRTFDTARANEWRRDYRTKIEVALISADIDNFKLYNDWRHLAGDDCITAQWRVQRCLPLSLQRIYP